MGANTIRGRAPAPPLGLDASAAPLQPTMGDGSDRQERKLFVGGLPAGCGREEFDAYFGQYGVLEDSIVMTDRLTGRTRGFGFVTYTTLEATEVILLVMYGDISIATCMQCCLGSGPHVLMDKMIDVKRAMIEGAGGSHPQSGGRISGGGDRRYPPMGKGKGGDYMYEGGYSSKYSAPPVGDGISFASPSDGYNPCKLFIGGIPSDLDQGRLDQFFSQYGNIVDSVVMKDRITGKPRGFAYVTYSTPEEAQTAINAGDANILDGKWLLEVQVHQDRVSVHHRRRRRLVLPQGRYLTLSIHRSSIVRPSSTFVASSPNGSSAVGGDNPSKVFIGGVPASVDNGRLQEVMSQYGRIIDCIIMTDRVTARPRGFAYCTYSTPEEAQAACNGGSNNSIDGQWFDVKPATRDPAVCGPGGRPSRGEYPTREAYDNTRQYQYQSPGPQYGQFRREGGSFSRGGGGGGRYDTPYTQGMYPQQQYSRVPYQQQQQQPYPGQLPPQQQYRASPY
ncbi:RNA-binding protein, putative [Perkinsus marinus ATCC 50983]|uniref:RNA-binding protein, putative n=1 Tax=Perkinsus marinus (strain ATCC 50983 / TXsc) TaxID=423536 RepID=C5KWD7_PERM5|nr:RNA-binding protein, putative [Perkinsus marinus ATCC 50983]EER11248.1 RNA-binding protein, putative [Perkinsus marinus ATCC 50983]|eukprot:XP_002779453.1 RNA-binding protein, putative [Perkinsus marinus ATCC 50983]